MSEHPGLAALLLITAASAGAGGWEEARIEPAPPGLPFDHVAALAWDGNSLWVGGFDGGLTRQQDGQWHLLSTPGPPQATWVNALCWHGGSLWVGSNAGLGQWDPISGRVEALTDVQGPVNGLRVCDGRLVVAGADTVLVEADSGWQQLDLTGESLHSAALVNGWVWTGGLRGILRKDGDRWRRYSELNGVLPDSWVTALEPVGGEVWVGTYDAGLLAINRAGQARVLRTGEWINPNAITPVPDGVAVGTQGDGLLLWDQLRRRWHRLTTADGLPSDNVTAILAVGDTLWVGARQGLARIDRSAPPSEGGIAR